MENENETMILIEKMKREEERHIGERTESSKSKIIKVSFWFIYTHTPLKLECRDQTSPACEK